MPVTVAVAPISVTTYLVCWGLGAAAWVAGSLWLAGRERLPRGRSAVALAFLVAAVLLGARLHTLLLELGLSPATLWRAPMLLLGTGFRLPGGLLLALLLAPLLARTFRLPLGPLADAAAPFVGVGLAIGRVGCLLRGCCFGHESDLPWALIYPAGTAAALNHAAQGLVPDGAASLPTHPLPLYLEVAGLALAAVLLWLRARRRYAGEVGLALVALVGLALGGLETFRETALVSSVPLRQALPLTAGGTAALLLVILRLYAVVPRCAHGSNR